MPRQARIVIPKVAHHITQRGNYRQRVFEEEKDYEQYCEWVREYVKKYNLSVLAYCLMSNHIHFIIVPREEETLARAFNTLHMRYSQYMNRKHNQHGHLFQGRFYSCFMDDEHLYRAIRYVERNPVRAQMVTQPWEYRWSSARQHIDREEAQESQIEVDVSRFPMLKSEWKRYLQAEDKQMCSEVRLKTQRGLGIGSEKFIKRIEHKLQRSLQCLSPGRPRKTN
ncbi:transposase [Thermodesulfobacteriota bacterium]